MHDVRLPNAGQIVFHSGFDERWRSSLPSKPARSVQRTRDEVLRGRSDIGIGTHAPQIYRLQRLETGQYPSGRAWPRKNIGFGVSLRFLQKETACKRVSN